MLGLTEKPAVLLDTVRQVVSCVRYHIHDTLREGARKLARLIFDLIPPSNDVERRWQGLHRIVRVPRHAPPVRRDTDPQVPQPVHLRGSRLWMSGVLAKGQTARRNEEHPGVNIRTGERRIKTGHVGHVSFQNLRNQPHPRTDCVANPRQPDDHGANKTTHTESEDAVVRRPPREVFHHAIDCRLQVLFVVRLSTRLDPRVEGSRDGERLIVVIRAANNVRSMQVVQLKTVFGQVQTRDEKLRDQRITAISTKTQNAKCVLSITLL